MTPEELESLKVNANQHGALYSMGWNGAINKIAALLAPPAATQPAEGVDWPTSPGKWFRKGEEYEAFIEQEELRVVGCGLWSIKGDSLDGGWTRTPVTPAAEQEGGGDYRAAIEKVAAMIDEYADAAQRIQENVPIEMAEFDRVACESKVVDLCKEHGVEDDSPAGVLLVASTLLDDHAKRLEPTLHRREYRMGAMNGLKDAQQIIQHVLRPALEISKPPAVPQPAAEEERPMLIARCKGCGAITAAYDVDSANFTDLGELIKGHASPAEEVLVIHVPSVSIGATCKCCRNPSAGAAGEEG